LLLAPLPELTGSVILDSCWVDLVAFGVQPLLHPATPSDTRAAKKARRGVPQLGCALHPRVAV
jgi:hypothetical protein